VPLLLTCSTPQQLKGKGDGIRDTSAEAKKGDIVPFIKIANDIDVMQFITHTTN